MRWQEGRTDDGQRFAVDDPAASTTARLLEGTHNARDKVRALLSLTAMFPERLSGDAAFEQRIAGYLERLQRGGARATVEQFVLERAGAPAGTGG
jgi:fructuronate reductase